MSTPSRRDFGAYEQLADAPHWVYVIRHRVTDRVIYVGMTCDLKRRLREHGNKRGWREPDFYATSTQVAGRAAAEHEEAQQIRLHGPTANRYGISFDGLVDA